MRVESERKPGHCFTVFYASPSVSDGVGSGTTFGAFGVFGAFGAFGADFAFLGVSTLPIPRALDLI